MIRDAIGTVACMATLYAMPYAWGFFGGAFQ
jgi:hypothetical protein